MANYKIGDTVVCVDPGSSNFRPTVLTKGQNYLVTDMYECGVPCVSVALPTRSGRTCIDCGRSAWAFAPEQFQKLDGLKESKTDLASRRRPQLVT